MDTGETIQFRNIWYPKLRMTNVLIQKKLKPKKLWLIRFSNSAPNHRYWIDPQSLQSDSRKIFNQLQRGDRVSFNYAVIKLGRYSHAWIFDFFDYQRNILLPNVFNIQDNNKYVGLC